MWGKTKNRVSESQCLCGLEIPRAYVFDGVTIADFNADGRIEKLSEFQSKSDHYYPYE